MSTSAGSHNTNSSDRDRVDSTRRGDDTRGSNERRDGDRDHQESHAERAVVTEDRRAVVDREKDEHGGIKFGSAFFGWLTATGMAVLLTALLAAAGTAVGLGTDTTVDQATSSATSDPSTVSWVGGIVLAVILFVAYYCGGYVAGRMARFDGAKQGLAVWLWALIIAVVLAVVGAIAGDQYNILAQLNSFPRIPISEGNLTTAGIIVAVAIAVITLLAAILGGLAGMRFHRKVDKTGLGR